jgi:hypothetical protein
MRFADYFGRAFSAVNSSQFPWVKMFRENTVAKLADVSSNLFVCFDLTNEFIERIDIKFCHRLV